MIEGGDVLGAVAEGEHGLVLPCVGVCGAEVEVTVVGDPGLLEAMNLAVCGRVEELFAGLWVGGCGDEKVEELLGADAGLVEQHLGRGGGQERGGVEGGAAAALPGSAATIDEGVEVAAFVFVYPALYGAR